MAATTAIGDGRVPRVTIAWPHEEPSPGTHFWADQVLSGLRSNGVKIGSRRIAQIPNTFAVIAEVDDGSEVNKVVFDPDDRPEVVDELVENALVYFKMQYAETGYRDSRVVPGGYLLANNLAYRYLPLLRFLRARRSFRYDVYGRFGLRYGGQDIRTRAHEQLSARTDLRYAGSLFKYPGGPEKVAYRRYLFEIPRAKVCVDMPGAGALCTRLIDYLAIGACVVGPRPAVRLPAPLIDGVHVVHCAPDLSDLGDICAQLVRDDETRERVARNARDYFERHLDRRRLGRYYVDQIVARLASGAEYRSGRLPSLASGG